MTFFFPAVIGLTIQLHISRAMNNLFWNNNIKVSGELSYVKGNEWIAGNLSYHLPERPKWIYDANEIFMCNKNLECIKYK